MSAPSHSRELKRLLADIASASPEDRVAILDELQPEVRAKATALLDDLDSASSLPELGEEQIHQTPLVFRAPAGLSPWLVQRFQEAQTNRTHLSSITKDAAASLVSAVAALPPTEPSADAPESIVAAMPSSPTFLHRVFSGRSRR